MTEPTEKDRERAKILVSDLLYKDFEKVEGMRISPNELPCFKMVDRIALALAEERERIKQEYRDAILPGSAESWMGQSLEDPQKMALFIAECKKLAVEEERERCAMIAEGHRNASWPGGHCTCGKELARAIREGRG